MKGEGIIGIIILYIIDLNSITQHILFNLNTRPLKPIFIVYIGLLNLNLL